MGEGVDRRPLYANGVEFFVDALADRIPSGLNGVTVDRASLTFNALESALAVGPARARFKDTGSVAAIEVTVSVGIIVSETVGLETTWSVAILWSLSERESLSKERAVGEMGDWFPTCVEMAKQASTNFLERLKV